MARRDDLIRAIRARWKGAELVGGLLDEALTELIDEYLETIGDAVGRELLEDPIFREELRREVLAMAFKDALTDAAQLDEAARELNRDVEELDPIGFVYLGPEDRITRDFCDVLIERWFTRDEIQRLDNNQLFDVFITRGGYNCRHGWYALFEGEEKEFTRGTQADIQRANDRARGA